MLHNLFNMLESLITSKTRLRLLIKFFINVSNTGYLRGLANEMHENTNAIRKELNNLSKAGYIVREQTEAKIMYKANTDHPLFYLVQQLVRKHVGLDKIVEQIFSKMGEVSRIYLIGDYAKGIDSGYFEIVVEGNDLNYEYLDQLAYKITKEIQKSVRIYVEDNFEGDGLLIFQK